MSKDFKVTVECNIPQGAAVDFIVALVKDTWRREITPPDALQLQRELRDQVKDEQK